MKANEFVKKFGSKSAKYWIDHFNNVNTLPNEFINTEFLGDLKRLVKSHDLIKSYKGCGKPKETALQTAKFTLKHFESTRGLEVELFGNNNRELELKQAIIDVESCQ